MSVDKGIDILDYFVLIAKWKKFIVILFLSSFAVAYITIYLFVEDQYDATATIIPLEDDNAGGITGLMKGLKGLPLNLGGISKKEETGRYNTIIFSRTNLENVIRKFDLFTVYHLDSSKAESMEKAVKRLTKNIITEETEESAFNITVRSNDPKRAAQMTNYVVSAMNDRVVSLKVSKSREARLFLEGRLAELRLEMRNSEDSLTAYQEHSNMYEVETQLKQILTAYSSLETDLVEKQLEKGILERLYDKESPQVKNMEIQISEYDRKLSQLRTIGQPGSLMLSMKSLPKTSEEYLRRFREVKISNALLEFIVPLYEQAKFDEKKDYPVLQIIDNAIPPSKRTYPPRTLFSLAIAFSILCFALIWLFLRENLRTSENARLLFVKNELFKFSSWKKSSS